MGNPSKAVTDFMAKYKICSDEVWEVHGSTWVVKHKALERVAAEQGIVWERPAMVETCAASGIAVMVVFGKLGDKTEWSMGEASPKNNKNAYPYAMAEKRAKDRVILKLLATHGSLYSESEAEEFSSRDGEGKLQRLAKKDAKEVYSKLQREMRECMTREMAKSWGEANADRIHMLPEDWEDTFRLQFSEHMADLRQHETVMEPVQ